MIARLVSEAAVLAAINALGTDAPDRKFEVSKAVTEASNEDPIFVGEDGAERTASVLLALANYESRFHASVIGDQGRSFGLYQIQPNIWKVDTGTLLLPRTASSFAIKLIRRSFKECERRPWAERLSWYAASGGCDIVHPKVVAQSISRMLLADKVFKRYLENGKGGT